MQLNQVGPDACLEFKALVYELLGVDPAALAKIDADTNSIAVGLNLFMRRTLERAIGSIWAKEEAVFRLGNSDAAPNLWWDAPISDLSTLFTFALVSVARKARGLPFLPLCSTAGERIVECPQDGAGPWTASECAAVTLTLLQESIIQTRDAPGPGAAQSLSVCDLVKQRLGLKPKDLVRPLYETQRETNRAFARDPEGQVIVGLAAFLIRLVEVSQQAVAQNIDSIRLLIWDASCGRESLVRLTNLSSLLTAGLLAEEGRDIAFLVRTPGPAYTANVH